MRAMVLAGLVLAFGAQVAAGGGGPPANEVVGTPAPETLLGTARRDRMEGRAGNDEIYAGNGHDEVLGGPGEDHVYGGDGNDLLWGSNPGHVADLVDYRRERLLGGAGNDVLASGMGGAVLVGGTGSDELHALARRGCRIDLDARRRVSDAPRCVIWLLGGPGRDQLWARNGAADVVVCGRRDVLRSADRIDRVYDGCETA
jgi:Ca2+-binding RTX toxin-like protein